MDGIRRNHVSRTQLRDGKSISDYTLGLHGGKYQFTDARFNPQSQSFAESLYASEDSQEQISEEPLPKWAQRMKDTMPTEGEELNVTQTTTVYLVNDEMTWERFYAFCVGPGDVPVTIEPFVGELPPRGGKATLQIRRTGVPVENHWLVVGTEVERCVYRLTD